MPTAATHGFARTGPWELTCADKLPGPNSQARGVGGGGGAVLTPMSSQRLHRSKQDRMWSVFLREYDVDSIANLTFENETLTAFLSSQLPSILNVL